MLEINVMEVYDTGFHEAALKCFALFLLIFFFFLFQKHSVLDIG